MHDSGVLRSLRLAALLAVVGLVPAITGCSTLGIAEVEDMEAMNRRLTQADVTTNDRVDDVDAAVNQLDPQMAALGAQLDSLGTSMTQMRLYIEGLELGDISDQAKRASAAATSAEKQFERIRAHYLRRLTEERDTLNAEIKKVEAAQTKSSKPAGDGKKATDGDTGDTGQNQAKE